MSEDNNSGAVSKETLRLLMEGRLGSEELRKLRHTAIKEEGRFWKYLEILQEKVHFKEKILLRLSDHLYIVAKDGRRIVKCDCGQEFGDYRANWKISSLVYVRKTKEEMQQVYTYLPKGSPYPEEGLVEIREYYCPGCLAQLGVEAVPPGYPAIFEMLPDIDSFYREWLGKPLPQQNPDPFGDKTLDAISNWGIKR
jgi:acetone carboxylase gamma subunit